MISFAERSISLLESFLPQRKVLVVGCSEHLLGKTTFPSLEQVSAAKI